MVVGGYNHRGTEAQRDCGLQHQPSYAVSDDGRRRNDDSMRADKIGHPGAGRGPGVTPVDLDSGLRRNDDGGCGNGEAPPCLCGFFHAG